MYRIPPLLWGFFMLHFLGYWVNFQLNDIYIKRETMKFKELLKKYKVYILITLLVILFFRSCSKSTQARKSEDNVTQKEMIIDSLQAVINSNDVIINGFPEILRDEKIKIHQEYDNYISEKDRGDQLMELHMIIKDNIQVLQNAK